ncbi:hypothetical protein ACTXT7_003355 [Hymenolepis weldensis]
MIRGPIIQLVMSSLVLIDALIVSAEIILEIQSVKGTYYLAHYMVEWLSEKLNESHKWRKSNYNLIRFSK